ncbi:hypothetical protein GCM10012283_27780 [Phycicoccus endophyticus]|nr:hypothetical protein GCM10012283_27780 [Phycicoccus endophyticus]
MRQEARSPDGRRLQVAVVPTWFPLRITNTPGTGIVDNLIWTIYLEIRQATARRWKVGVVEARRMGSDRVLYQRRLRRGESREDALQALVAECQESGPPTASQK